MMKIILPVILALALAVPAGAIPIHNISLNLGVAIPGESEIADFYSVASLADSIRAYGVGIGYDFAPLEFVSIGAGVNMGFRGFKYVDGSATDEFSIMSIEPYGQLRFYLPVMEGFDIFAGGGGGYTMLAGSNFKNGQGGADQAITGGSAMFRFGAGAAYNQGLFTAIVDMGYKSSLITPDTAVTNPESPANPLKVNMGGLYFTISAAVSMGSHADAKNEGEIRKQLDKDVEGLEGEPATDSGDEPLPEAKVEDQPKDGPVTPAVQPSLIKSRIIASDDFIESNDFVTEQPQQAAAAETPAPAAEAPAAETPAPAAETPAAETPVPAVEAAAQPTPAQEQAVQADQSADDTEGIIIISPGESEASELEKYITKKSQQFKKADEEGAEPEETGEDVVFQYEPEDAGVIVVEAESKGTIDKAGYVLVEKGGFISNNFAEDGFIYSLDPHRELLAAGDFAYIKLTSGIGAPKGKQFTLFDDSEEVTNQQTGEPMGRMVKLLGVAKVTGPIEDNIFKVQITKSYEPIRNNYKIKARQDLKKYHKEINLKVRKKNVEVRAYIVKVKGDVLQLSNRDIVYIDAGIAKGLLPGEKLGIFREHTDKLSGKSSEYDRIGTLIVINSMQTSAVGLIVYSSDVIRVGDVVKTAGK